uniref:Uncharacterized protein n=2 Tax=Caenorhabditis japonica TaxID=281687 RepID=A0A8R1DQ62_CAEJA
MVVIIETFAMASLLVLLLLPALLSAEDNGLSVQFPELNMHPELLRKLQPLPRVPHFTSRTHRVGAQRFQQFGERCWHEEPCDKCVCCGGCLKEPYICHSPPMSLDMCRIYELISLYTNIEKKNSSISYKLPDDFPDV